MKNPFTRQTIRIHNLNDANITIRTFFYFLNLKIWETERTEYHDEVPCPEPHFPILMEHYLDELFNHDTYASDKSRAV